MTSKETKNPQNITDVTVISKLKRIASNIDTTKSLHNIDGLMDAIESYAAWLIESGLDKSNDIEVYSPVLADSIILKARISEWTKTTIKYDYSMFRVNTDNATQEHYVASSHLKTQDLAKALIDIFKDIKAFIPFNKFDLSNNEIAPNDLASFLTKHYKAIPPVSYD